MASKTLTDKHGDVITISDGGLTLATRGHVVVHVKETTPGRVHTAAAYADPADLRAALDEVAPVQEQAGSCTRADGQARTEGAEELARLIAQADVGEWNCGDLADALLATGRVRVAGAES